MHYKLKHLWEMLANNIMKYFFSFSFVFLNNCVYKILCCCFSTWSVTKECRVKGRYLKLMIFRADAFSLRAVWLSLGRVHRRPRSISGDRSQLTEPSECIFTSIHAPSPNQNHYWTIRLVVCIISRILLIRPVHRALTVGLFSASSRSLWRYFTAIRSQMESPVH